LRFGVFRKKKKGRKIPVGEIISEKKRGEKEKEKIIERPKGEEKAT